MPDGRVSGLRIVPERFYDVGIAEQHADTGCRACHGRVKPVVAIYSTFYQRYDWVLHDVAQKLDVVFAVDRCGIVVMTERHIREFMMFHIYTLFPI